MFPVANPGNTPTEISGYPPRIPARFPPGSCRDFGRRESRLPPRIPVRIPAGTGNPGGQNLGGIPAGILPGSCQDPAKIPVPFLQGMSFDILLDSRLAKQERGGERNVSHDFTVKFHPPIELGSGNYKAALDTVFTMSYPWNNIDSRYDNNKIRWKKKQNKRGRP